MKKLKDFIIQNLMHSRENLLTICDSLSDADLVQVPPNCKYCIKALLIHIAETEEAWIEGVMLGGEYRYGERFRLKWYEADTSKLPSYKQIREYLHEVRSNLIDTLQELQVFDFEDALRVFNTGKKVTVADAVSHLQEHELLHVGEIRLMVELLGKRPPEIE
jgi:uncharacterized damage-inducible protein DinB